MRPSGPTRTCGPVVPSTEHRWRHATCARAQAAQLELDALLAAWRQQGLLVPQRSPHDASGDANPARERFVGTAETSGPIPSPRVVDLEYLTIDAALQARSCLHANWHLCASIWHQDAMIDRVGRYKIWTLLSRQERIEGALFTSLGLDPAAGKSTARLERVAGNSASGRAA